MNVVHGCLCALNVGHMRAHYQTLFRLALLKVVFPECDRQFYFISLLLIAITIIWDYENRKLCAHINSKYSTCEFTRYRIEHNCIGTVCETESKPSNSPVQMSIGAHSIENQFYKVLTLNCWFKLKYKTFQIRQDKSEKRYEYHTEWHTCENNKWITIL